MLGNIIVGSSSDHQKVLALINNPTISDAQKAAFCYDRGLCEKCGIKTVFVGPFKRRPLTNERVLNGVCRLCHPERCASDTDRPAGPWEKMQKFAVPSEAFLAKTSGAFTSLQKGINNISDNIKSTDMNERTKSFTEETSNAFTNLQASVTGGINTLNEGINDMRTKRMEQKRSKESLSSLKNTFKEKDDDLDTKTERNNPPQGLLGSLVSTPYGRGIVQGYREEDGIFEIDLVSEHMNDPTNSTDSGPKLFCKQESFDVELNSRDLKKKSMEIMELNAAIESLEKISRLNLELECQDRGVTVDYSVCKQCLLNGCPEEPQKFRRIRKLINDHTAPKPCLFCNYLTCSSHSCNDFRKEGITACSECTKVFESEYVVACLNQAHGLSDELAVAGGEGNNSATEDRPLEMMMDLYDRVLLLLRYSSQYIEPIAIALEEQKKRSNNVNIGASSTGIVSGIAGVAAAATIFTPAGVPLLIASLTLGAGATAAQTGTEAVSYFSDPNKFADKILALIGMVHSILKVHSSLRDVLTARLLAQEGNAEIDRLKNSLMKLRGKQKEVVAKSGVKVSTAILSGAALAAVETGGAVAAESAAMAASLEVGTIASRQASMMSRSTMAAARGARFARGLGGALSAATILLEARTLKKTTEQIRLGSPCEKADALRSILVEIPNLPTTDQLDEECRIFVGALSNRVNATSLEDAINLIENQAMREWQATKQATNSEELAPEQASILEGDTEDDDSDWESVTGVLTASMKGHSTSELGNREDDSNTSESRITQSMPRLPSHPTDSQSQSALLDRIKKFKDADK